MHAQRQTLANSHTSAIQGVEWIDEHRLMFASDRAKADQPFICTTRDQGVHVSRQSAGLCNRCNELWTTNGRPFISAALKRP